MTVPVAVHARTSSGPGRQMAAAAATKAGGTVKAFYVIKELAKLSQMVNHEQLQGAAAQLALEAMAHVEECSQRCIQLLVCAMGAPETKPELAADAAWMLHTLTQRCDVSRQWRREADGLEAVRTAIARHSEHYSLVQWAVGTVRNLSGLRGLASLLGVGAGRLPDAVVASILWSVYDLLKKERDSNEAVELLRLLVQILTEGSHDIEVQSACCSAIGAVIIEDARLGALLVELGGVPLLLNKLRQSRTLGPATDTLTCACINTLASLAKGSSSHAEVIRQHGGVQVLAQLDAQGRSGCEDEAAMWAIGYLGGIGTVLQAMSHAPASQAVVRGGLGVIAELACQLNAPYEVSTLPEVLQALLNLWCQISSPSQNTGHRCRKKCIGAICSTVTGLVPHADPGQVPELDRAVLGLLNLQTQEIVGDADVEIAELTLECLGRQMLIRPSWQRHLQQFGAEEVFSQRIRTGRSHSRMLKYAFWASAALSGLPFVCQQLQQHLRSADTIIAGFCTIIDILDDDVEGDWVLRQAERCDENAVPGVLRLVSEAMEGYLGDALLQSRGCHCIGLLAAHAPLGAAPRETVAAVFAALRRHPRCSYVARDACYAFHALLEPVGGGLGPVAINGTTEDGTRWATERREAVAALLREGGAEAVCRQSSTEFADLANVELLEEATVVLCALAGVAAVLVVLAEAGPGPARTVGIKALAEFSRQQPLKLRGCAEAVASAVVAMAAESMEDAMLQQNAALVLGFCEACRGSEGAQ